MINKLIFPLVTFCITNTYYSKVELEELSKHLTSINIDKSYIHLHLINTISQLQNKIHSSDLETIRKLEIYKNLINQQQLNKQLKERYNDQQEFFRKTNAVKFTKGLKELKNILLEKNEKLDKIMAEQAKLGIVSQKTVNVIASHLDLEISEENYLNEEIANQIKKLKEIKKSTKYCIENLDRVSSFYNNINILKHLKLTAENHKHNHFNNENIYFELNEKKSLALKTLEHLEATEKQLNLSITNSKEAISKDLKTKKNYDNATTYVVDLKDKLDSCIAAEAAIEELKKNNLLKLEQKKKHLDYLQFIEAEKKDIYTFLDNSNSLTPEEVIAFEEHYNTPESELKELISLQQRNLTTKREHKILVAKRNQRKIVIGTFISLTMSFFFVFTLCSVV